MKKEDIKFSVLMSVYYKEKPGYLKQAIESIINQTLLPTEFIIMKDGPLTKELDNCLDYYLKKYNFIKCFSLKKNMGLGIALNEGLKHCSYDYVARMDSDDMSLPNRFKKQIGYLQKHPECDMIGSNTCEYDESLSIKTSDKHVPEKDEEIKKYMKKRNPFNHMSVVYRKSKVLEAGSYEDCPFFEDYYLWCRMAKNGCNFFNIQEPLLNVRAGIYMMKKRGGSNYNKCIIDFEKRILKLGIINKFEYFKNVVIRVLVSSFPKKLRMSFYKKKLRS